ncbi:MAG TPA: CvpA family protein [Chthoniobacterales bacterium]|nr:CvpA family protein [Chthoniobacterales bacterium]
MMSQVQAAAGSPLWQIVFVSFAAILVLFEILRGWRRGLPRQVARLGALVAAYFAGWFASKFFGPLLGIFVRLPDSLLSVLAGALFALIIYAVVSGTGSALFRRTDQHDSLLIRLLYGSTGAVLGAFFGLFLVWLIIVGIRSVGSVANAEVREQANDSTVVHAVDVRRRIFSENTEDEAPLTTSLARLKNSVEMGVIGNMVKKTDIIPPKTYDLIEKIGTVASNPQYAERFLEYPGAKELSEHPKIVALRNDQEVAQMLAQGQLMELIQDHRVIDAANDPELRERLKKFDVNAALTYAIQK